MKKSRFSEHQIIALMKSVEAGRIARDVCREYGISNARFMLGRASSRYGSFRYQTYARS